MPSSSCHSGSCDGEERVQALEEKAELLLAAWKKSEADEKAIGIRVEEAARAIDAAEANVKAAIASEEEYASTKGNSLAEVARARAAVEAATEVVDEAKKKHGFLSGEGSTVDVSDQSATPRAPSTEACASAVRKLSDRDLTEVRRLPNPPALARRALELVQAMIACTEGP